MEDDEDEDALPLFETKEERMYFVRKVYFILSVMWFVDAVMITCALFIPGARKFFAGNLILYICSYLVFFIVYLILVCVRQVRQSFPANYIMLGLLTISFGFMVSCIAAYHSIEELLLAAGGTMAVTLAVTLLACCGTFDITGWGIYLCIASLVLMLCGFVVFLVCYLLALCGESGRIWQLVICSLFVLLYSVYLLYDTQIILGGGRVRMEQDEHVLGAIQLWIDMANIFLCLLKIIGQSN